jgi:4a-hydroxytetrahydrobiopterin dehydratase
MAAVATGGKRTKARPAVSPMKSERVQSRLIKMPGWETTSDGKSIVRTYELPSFRAALAFVAWVGELAEAADHHPDLDVRFRKVIVRCTSWDAGGITERDLALADRIDHRL